MESSSQASDIEANTTNDGSSLSNQINDTSPQNVHTPSTLQIESNESPPPVPTENNDSNSTKFINGFKKAFDKVVHGMEVSST
jgi:predicted lipid-binding transport protein (Tim44 family)